MAYGRAVILQAARMLLEIERKLPKRRQCQRKIVSEMSNIEILHNNFENEDLLCELEDVDISDPIIVAWKTRLLENIRNSNTLIVDTAQRDTEILHKAAAEVLENELYGYEKHPTLICQNEITALFGSLRSGAKLHPVTKLLQQWFISLHAGMTPSETRRQLGADREAVAGYNSAEERALLIRLLTDWERRMDDLTAEKPAVLLGAIHPSWVTKRRRYGGGGITSDRYVRNHTVIVSSLPWIHSTNTSALICHPTIATYAARDGGDMGSASLADYATPVPLTGLLTDSDVVNMLSLWNPHDSASVYHTVAAALKATKLL